MKDASKGLSQRMGQELRIVIQDLSKVIFQQKGSRPCTEEVGTIQADRKHHVQRCSEVDMLPRAAKSCNYSKRGCVVMQDEVARVDKAQIRLGLS